PPPPRGHESRHVLLEPGPRLPDIRAGVRAVPPPPVESRPGRRQLLADPVTRLVFLNAADGEAARATLYCPLPAGVGRLPGCPVRRRDAPQPGAPIRPVDAFHPPLPALPVRRRSNAGTILGSFRHNYLRSG